MAPPLLFLRNNFTGMMMDEDKNNTKVFFSNGCGECRCVFRKIYLITVLQSMDIFLLFLVHKNEFVERALLG